HSDCSVHPLHLPSFPTRRSSDLRIASMRSPSKNMCSVRHKPMPPAPKATAFAACSGVSAFVRTSIRVAFEHQFINFAKLMNWCRSEEHTSELQLHLNLVCRLLLE